MCAQSVDTASLGCSSQGDSPAVLSLSPAIGESPGKLPEGVATNGKPVVISLVELGESEGVVGALSDESQG